MSNDLLKVPKAYSEDFGVFPGEFDKMVLDSDPTILVDGKIDAQKFAEGSIRLFAEGIKKHRGRVELERRLDEAVRTGRRL